MTTKNFNLRDNEGNDYNVAIEHNYYYDFDLVQSVANRFLVAAVEFEGRTSISSPASKELRIIDLPTGQVLASTTMGVNQFLVKSLDKDTQFQIGEIVSGKLEIKSYDYTLASNSVNLGSPVGSKITITPPLQSSWDSYDNYEFAGTLGSGGYLLVGEGSGTSLYKLASGTTPQATQIALPPGTYNWIGNPFVYDGKLWLQANSGDWGTPNWSQTLYQFNNSDWTTVGDEDVFWSAWDVAIGYQSVIRDGNSGFDLLNNPQVVWPTPKPDGFYQEFDPVRLPDGSLLARVGTSFKDEKLDIGYERWLVIKDGQKIADKVFATSSMGLGLRSLQAMDDGYVYFQQIDASFTGSAGQVTALQQNAGGVTLYKIAHDKIASVLRDASDSTPLNTLAGASNVIRVGQYTQAQLPGAADATNGKIELVQGYLPASLLVAGDQGAIVWSVMYDPQIDSGVPYLSRIEAGGTVTNSTKLTGGVSDVLFDGRWCAIEVDGDNGLSYYRLDPATGALTLIDDAQQGSDAADSLTGSAGSDILLGVAGNDTLLGGSGNDTLMGGEGSDVLVGGAGNDVLDGGVMTDLAGSSDLNIVSYNEVSKNLTISLAGITGDGSTGSGFAKATNSSEAAVVGSDTLYNISFVKAGSGNDTITGSSAQILEQFEGGLGNDTIDGGAIDIVTQRNGNRANYQYAKSAVTVTLADAAQTTSQGSATGGAGNDVLIRINQVRGSNYGDTLTGSDGKTLTEHFEGMAGKDTIDGKGGFDVVSYRSAGTGVKVNLAAGAATQDGYGSVDTLINIEGVFGSKYKDVLTGGNNANGSNYTTDVAKIEIFRGDGGNDTIDGDAGFDRAEYTTSESGVVANLETGVATDGFGNKDKLLNIEGIRGSDFDDLLRGSDRNTYASDGYFEFFEGRAGDDVIDGRGGFDFADYQTAPKAVNVNLFTGVATDGYGTTDTLLNIDGVRGSSFNDTITGNAQANVLNGNAGNDILFGGLGNDTLDGGVGIDTASYSDKTKAVVVTLNGSTAVTVRVDGVVEDSIKNVENLIGGSAADTLTGDTLANVLTGNAGNDNLSGLDGGDILNGGKGADVLTGGNGKDTFVFSAGDSGQLTGVDQIKDYLKGAVGTGDLIDFASLLKIGGSAATTTSTEALINATTGVATFAAASGTTPSSGTTLSDALLDIATRFTKATDSAGEFAFFKVNGTGDFYLFVSDGTAGVTANDVVVQLVGVTSIGGIDVTSGNLTITS